MKKDVEITLTVIRNEVAVVGALLGDVLTLIYTNKNMGIGKKRLHRGE